MAITSVIELHGSEQSEQTAEKATAVRAFIVTANSYLSTVAAETAYFSATAIPLVGDSHPDDQYRYVTSISAEHISDDFRKCKVTVQYESDGSIENPLDEPADIKFSASDKSEPYFRDVDGKPVVNACGEPFEDFLERDTGTHSITITRTEATFDHDIALEYKHVINSDMVIIDGNAYSPGLLKLGLITADRVTHGDGTVYYKVTYPIQINRAGFDHLVENRGLNELIDDELWEIVKGSPAVKVDKPYPLDASGAAKANPTDTPTQITFKPYLAKSFARFAFN